VKILRFLALMTVLLSGAVFAQTSDPTVPAGDAASAAAFDPTPDISTFQRKIQRLNTEADQWHHAATFQLALAILVAVVGGATSFLQKGDRPWQKSATVACGALTAVLTTIVTLAYPNDHRELRRAVVQARQAADQLNDCVVQFQRVSAQNADQLRKFCTKQINDIGEVEKTILVRAPILETDVVYASTAGLPKWTYQAPSSDTFLYWVGTGSATSLAAATDASQQQAFSACARHLLGQVKYAQSASQSGRDPLTALVRAVARTAVVEDTAFSYDMPTQSYKVYSLVRLDRTFDNPDWVNRAIRSAPVAVQTAARSPQLLLRGITVKDAGGAGGAAWAFDITVDSARAFTVPVTMYDAKKQKEVMFNPPNAFPAPGKSKVAIQIRATRDGHPLLIQKSASMHIPPLPSELDVPVAHTIPRQGSFVLHFGYSE
jgi:hypothetical protein